MRCCVPSCTNDTKHTTKSHGITFHLFPKEPNLRSTWLTALGITHWEPNDRSAICSEHFRNDDFYLTKCGLRRIRSAAVPFVAHLSEEDLEAPAVLRVCRICLAMDSKLYDLRDFKLDSMLEQATGLMMTEEDKLPQKLCWECAHRAFACCRFKTRALRSRELMMAVLETSSYITVRDIKSINRTQNQLISPLVQKIYEPDCTDMVIVDGQVVVKPEDNREEVKVETDEVTCTYGASDLRDLVNLSLEQKVYEPDCTDMVIVDGQVVVKPEDNREEVKVETDEQIYEPDCTDMVIVDGQVVVKPEDNREEVKVETDEIQIDEIQVKNEDDTNEIFFQDYVDGFDDSDDDKTLSEVFAKPKARVRKKREKDKVKVEKKKKKCDDDDSPTSTMDKYKTSDVKRRKTQEALDENLFNITTLTYEEQIAEIASRQQSDAYKNAIYKCTVCYRGFHIKDRLDAHAVRHTDQSGAYECFICKTRLKTGRALRKHITAQHTEQYSCKGCPFVTRNRGVAREHEKWHSGTKYQCPHCPSEFDKLTTYMGHIRIKHVSDFVCELCGYTFVSKKGIDVHKKKKHRLAEKTVSLEGPYCEVCDVTFVSEDAHERHLKLSSKHSSDSDPNRIRNDSQSMHAERSGRVVRRIERRPVVHPRPACEPGAPGPVACEQCGLQLRDLRLYAQHFRRAHPDKNRTKYPAMKTPCMCEQCGRLFQSMALLKDHMWVHTGEKRFKCERCDKSFTQKTNLVFHMRVHSATRPTYECPLCGKHFAFFNNRRRHMFIHTGLKPYKCDTCGKCFTTTGEQRAHVEHVHLKKPWPKRARARARDDWQKCAVSMED
ncbi:zinc finger protein 879 [Amyelois transitella]|uniref:zinc finger protein 879 n=1 Tax=Amyelois transitella TaxID=680683 RepID=UPI00298F4F70|nr:zinc finger protein 879 [Amyelois transitella]